jgi:hypothetical protein
MNNQRNLTGPGMLILAGLTLAAAGCGGDDVLGANEGRVRFVLSSDAAGVLSAGEDALSALPELRGGAESTTVEPALHGDDDDGDRTGWFQTANVTFSSILARNEDGVLVNIDMDLPVTVDMVKMQGGREIELPPGDLPLGTYDQLVVVMTEVEGTAFDGTIIAITPPGGGWTSIVPICPFEVVEGSPTVVGLSFKLRNAFSWREKRYHFQPRFSCDGNDSGTSD